MTKFYNKNCSVEKAQADQYVDADGPKKYNEHVGLKYANHRSIKQTIAILISQNFAN